jgi:hypothetical protein
MPPRCLLWLYLYCTNCTALRSCKRIHGWIVVIAEVSVSDFMPRGTDAPSTPINAHPMPLSSLALSRLPDSQTSRASAGTFSLYSAFIKVWNRIRLKSTATTKHGLHCRQPPLAPPCAPGSPVPAIPSPRPVQTRPAQCDPSSMSLNVIAHRKVGSDVSSCATPRTCTWMGMGKPESQQGPRPTVPRLFRTSKVESPPPPPRDLPHSCHLSHPNLA